MGKLLFCNPLLCGQIFDGRIGSDGLHRFDAFFHTGLAGVHLAGANDLFVASQQVEMELAVGSLLAFVVIVLVGIFFYTFDAVFASWLSGVALAGKHHLAVSSLQAKIVFFVIFTLEYFELHKGLKFDVYVNGMMLLA